MKNFLSIGTGPGIGLATAERFAREGYRVILSSRSPEKGGPLAEKLISRGFEAEFIQVDASDDASIHALFKEVSDRFGQVDVLHYNAATLRKATLHEQRPATFYADLSVNIGGALVAVQAAAPAMESAGAGTILLTGGHFGVEPNADFISLSIGKAGIRALTLGLFSQMESRGIHIATVTVGAYVSPDSAEAAEIAESFMTLHQQSRDAWLPEMEYSAPHTITD